MINPFAPHVSEELFERIGESKTIAETTWPKYEESKTIDNEIELPVQDRENPLLWLLDKIIKFDFIKYNCF